MENLQPTGYICRYKSLSHFPADTCSTSPLPLARRRGRWENWPRSSCWFILIFWIREFILISWMNESVPLFQMIRVSVCPWNISQLHCDIRNKIHCVFCKSQCLSHTYEIYLSMILNLVMEKQAFREFWRMYVPAGTSKCVRCFLQVLSCCLMYLLWICHQSGWWHICYSSEFSFPVMILLWDFIIDQCFYK